MTSIIQGLAFHCGDCVNTDVMAPGRFEPYENDEALARAALLDYEGRVPFVSKETGRSPFSVIFAGEEFGCGSSRETAPRALSLAGVSVVIARSFARIFLRNCVNMGLVLPVTYPHSFDEGITGEHVSVDTVERSFRVRGEVYRFPDFGPLARIIEAGGLIPYTKAQMSGGR